MTIIEFSKRYGREEQCREYLFSVQWSEGFRCPKCGGREYFDIKSRELYQCKEGNYQASVTAGTIMDKSRTPLSKWFMALYLMSEDNWGIRALSLKKKIEVAYQTAWSMSHKIRHAMSEREKEYELEGSVEIDEAFFGSPTEGAKRGRGTEKTAVCVAVSLTQDDKPKYAKMRVVEAEAGQAVDGETAKTFVEQSISKGSQIRTDGLNIYKGLAKNGYALNQKEYDPKKHPEHLHWIHILISNAKALLAGTFHGLDSRHLQRYLDEFCYRFNWRHLYSGLCLLTACPSSHKISYHDLIG